MRLEDKITVITGAGSGTGKAMAKPGVPLPVDGGYCIGFTGMGAENTGAPGG